MTPTPEQSGPFENKKKITKNGQEYWMGRDLQELLGYATWENFYQSIERATLSCQTTGVNPLNHFRETTKMIEGGKGAKLPRVDCFLTRYACYLIAMNGEPSKPEIAVAQAYFVVQTRRQEVSDQQALLEQRLDLRERVANSNKHLSSAAKEAGVQSAGFGIFHDAGYKGLYGRSLSEIKKMKKLPPKADLLDHAGRAELAANEFRITQTEQRLKKESIRGQQKACDTHMEVGKEVRRAIQKIGGKLPEHLPAEESIKKLAKLKPGTTEPPQLSSSE